MKGGLRISEIIAFMEDMKAENGDVRVQVTREGNRMPVTGFWPYTIPASGERVLVCGTGDGPPTS